MLDLGDREPRRARHHRIEVARRLPVDEVALRVALEGVDEGDVGDEPGLHEIGLVVEVADFLALGDVRPDAGAGEEGRDAGAAGANALGQRALRRELELELAGQIEVGENLVLADVARDHLPDLSGLEQDAKADAVDAGVVGDDGQILHAGFAQGLDQGFGDAAEAEASGHDHHAVPGGAGERLVSGGVDFFHEEGSRESAVFLSPPRVDCKRRGERGRRVSGRRRSPSSLRRRSLRRRPTGSCPTPYPRRSASSSSF